VDGLLARTGLGLLDRSAFGLALGRFVICSLVIAEPSPRPALGRDDLMLVIL
jgi:hypothetical protein